MMPNAPKANGSSVSAISDRLDAARQELAQAEGDTKPRTLTNDDIRELENAHEALLDAERKATSRLGGNRAKRGERLRSVHEADHLRVGEHLRHEAEILCHELPQPETRRFENRLLGMLNGRFCVHGAPIVR